MERHLLLFSPIVAIRGYHGVTVAGYFSGMNAVVE
jgi:hypothetical protein